MHVDAIVNVASRLPIVNAGVDSAKHKKAGPALLEARKKIGYIAPGTEAITPAFGMDADYVIHAATPPWTGGLQSELKLLRQAYDMCLELAVKSNCDSIAFPLLAAGNHGFPKGKALQAAIAACSEFLTEQEMQIYLVVVGRESTRLSEQLFHKVASYIDQNYVDTYNEEVYGGVAENRRRDRYPMPRSMEIQGRSIPAPCAPKSCAEKAKSLIDFIKDKYAGFTETLLALIKKSGRKNSEVYKKANISKQHFSKLINDPDAKPSKQTAIALALALELDMVGA